MPTIATKAPTNITYTEAQLNGLLGSDDKELCDVSFEYGEDTGYGTATPAQKAGTKQDVDDDDMSFGEGTLTDVEANSGLNLKYNSALEFVYAGGDKITPPLSAFPTGDYLTLEFWNYGTYDIADTYTTTMIYVNDSNGDRTINIHLPYNATVYWDCGNDGTGYDRISKVVDIATELKGWHHWAFTKNAVSGYMKIYLDGSLWHSGTGKTKSILDIANISAFGNYSGRLSDFRVWSEERTQAQIQDNMNNWLTGDETNLVTYYKLDEGVGTTINDSAGSNDGTLTSGNWIKYYTSSDWYRTDLDGIGTRQSPQLDLSKVDNVSSSIISWTSTEPANTSILIETSVDGGLTWQTATNGEAIPNMPANPTTLDVRQTLSTSDTTVTPTLDSLTVEVTSQLSYQELLDNLTENTEYHFRAVAQNSVGTAYGADWSFTTIKRYGEKLMFKSGAVIVENGAMRTTNL